MIDVLGLIGLASAVAGKQPVAQTLHDAEELYTDLQAVEKHEKLADMDKAGEFVPAVQALARETALLAQLVIDPTQKARVLALAAAAGL